MMSNIASGESIMEGGLAVLCPFQQCFSHIRTMGDDQERLCAMVEKISPWSGLKLWTARSVLTVTGRAGWVT